VRLRRAAFATGLYYRRTTTAKWYKAAERSLYAMSSLKEQLGSGEKRQQVIDDAIKVFEKNVQEYPESSNVYDSLAEAYAAAGKKDLAIQKFEKSLQLNAKNENAKEQLKKLKGEQ